jgi:hypothetical protein
LEKLNGSVAIAAILQVISSVSKSPPLEKLDGSVAIAAILQAFSIVSQSPSWKI